MELELEEQVKDLKGVDLMDWLRIHHPRILQKYERQKEQEGAFITE